MKRAAVAALILLLVTAGARAQTTSAGSIRGYVRDTTGGVLPGVTVTAVSPTVPGVRTAASDTAGYYRLTDLPPGTYTVTFELEGFSKVARDGVLVRAGGNVPLDTSMNIGGLTDTVEVKAETPMLEAKDVLQAVNISGDFQRSVPLSARRDWADFLQITPGVVTVQYPGIAGMYYLHGADYSSHVLQVDGADMASAAQGYNGFISLSSEALGDVQVKTGAIDASAPIGLGAVVNLATPSGTNAIKGAVGFVYQARRWNGSNVEGGSASSVQTFQPDLSVGGPIVRDRLWLFGALRFVRQDTGVSRTAEQIALLRALRPAFEPFGSKNDANFAFVKATTQFSSRHRVQAFYQRDDNPSDLVNATDADRFVFRGPRGWGGSVQLSSVWTNSLTSRFAVAYNNKANESELYSYDKVARTIHQSAFPSSGVLMGTGPIAFLDNSGAAYLAPYKKWTVSGDFTYYKNGWIGSHELQFGVYGQPLIRVKSDVTFSGGGTTLQEEILRNPLNPAAGTLPFHRQKSSLTSYTDQFVDSSDYAVYVQDAWRIRPRLTLTAGIRADFIKRTDKLFNLTVQDSTAVGPRIGVNYIVTEDQRNAVRASWSRVHETLAQNIVSAGTNLAGVRDEYDLDLNGTFETVLETPAYTAVARDRVLDLGRNQPRVDEFMVGYRRQFPKQVAVDISWLRREYRDRTAYVDVNSIIENGVFKGYKDPTQNAIYEVTGNTWNWPVYNGLELQVAKQGGRVQVIGSISRQWRHIAGGWQPNDPASFIQPDAFENTKGIGNTRGGTGDANSLSGRSMAAAQAWRDYTGSLAVNVLAPLGVNLATNFTYQSGLWSGPIVSRVGAPDPRFGSPAVVLPTGRVVANPLATTIRFAGSTRSDNQFRSDAIKTWNLRVGRTFRFGSRTLEPAVDFYNLTNAGADQFLMPGANQTYNPFYKQGFLRQLPRSAQVSLRFVY